MRFECIPAVRRTARNLSPSFCNSQSRAVRRSPMRRGRTTSFKGKDWQRLPYFGLNLCSTQSRAGRTPPPREARNVRMLTAPTPGRPTLKSTFLIHRPICRVRPVAHPPSGKAAGRRGRRPFRVARARPIHRPFWEVRPRRASPAPLMRRPRRVARFLSEPRYSLSTYSSSPPAESSNELRRVAARRVE